MIFSPAFLAHVANSSFLADIKRGEITVDNSTSSQWFSCFAAGVYSGALRRMNARSRSPLAFGGAVHAGLESFFRGETEWRDRALADAAISELDSLGDPRRNTSKLLDLLESYTLEYSRNPSMQFNILTIDGKPAVEKSFVVPLGVIDFLEPNQWNLSTLRINWSGKLDILAEYEGALAMVDHKTTSVMGEKFVDDKVRSTQMLGYTYAARFLSRELFNGMPVFGARINALASRSAGYEFKIFDIPFPDWKVSEWQQETLAAIKALVVQLNLFLSTGLAVPTREHCVTKYGKCAYFDVCDAAPQMRDRIIFDDDYFFVSNWSPLNE